MDLRPKLTEDFLDVIFEDLDQLFADFDEDHSLREKWRAAILERFIARSLPVQSVSNEDQRLAEQFIAKYPAIQPLIDLCKAEALRRWPQTVFTFALHSSPEDCHICHEGQHLILRINPGLAFYDEEGGYGYFSPHRQANNEWGDWVCSEDGPYRQLEDAEGFSWDLFTTDLIWEEDETNE